MTKYNIIILQNSLEFTRFFLESYPRLNAEDITFHIVFDDRHFSQNLFRSIKKEFALSSTRKDFDPSKVVFHLGSEMIEAMAEELGLEDDSISDEIKSFYHQFVLTLKLVPFLYLHKVYGVDKILYLDDDCILMKDPRPIIDKYEFAMTRDVFCTLKDPWADRYLEAYGEICGKAISLDQYNKDRMCAGITILSFEPSLPLAISRFFQSEFLRGLWKGNTSQKKYNRVFFLEQFFFNFYFKACVPGRWSAFSTSEASYGTKALCDPLQRPKKFMKVKSMYHYGVGASKLEWIEAFKSVLIADKLFLQEYGDPYL